MKTARPARCRRALDVRRLAESAGWNPELHPRGEGGRFIRGLLDAGNGPDNPLWGRGFARTATRGGSHGSFALSVRPAQPDDRVVDPANPRRMGTVLRLEQDRTQMRVRWDDGHEETRRRSTVHDPWSDPKHWYGAQPQPEPARMDAKLGGPPRTRTPRERIADQVADGHFAPRERMDLLASARQKAGIPEPPRPKGGALTRREADEYATLIDKYPGMHAMWSSMDLPELRALGKTAQADIPPRTRTKDRILLQLLRAAEEGRLALPKPKRARKAREAAGMDTHPGGEQLHHYWTRGEGLAKWAESPHPWTSLFHHLSKYMAPEKAKRTAAEWFHDVFHFWPGSDLNRVTHGKPPRGHNVGPG